MKVLLAIGEPRGANVAAKFLETIPFPHGSTVTVLHIVELPRLAPQFPAYYRIRESWRQQALAAANRLVTSVAERLRGSGLRVQTRVVEGVPRRDLVKAIRMLRADLAVLGPHMYPRVVRFLLGSVSEYALGKAPCSVLIARSRRRITKARVPRIILATDFSRDAEAAATWLRKLELPRASQITVVHVEELAEEVIARFVARGRLDLHQALIQAMGTRWQELARRLEERGKRFTRRGWKVQPLLLKGNPAEQILKLATKQQADLLVLGSRGVSGLKAILLGSVSHKVVQHASCSVMVVKGTRR